MAANSKRKQGNTRIGNQARVTAHGGFGRLLARHQITAIESLLRLLAEPLGTLLGWGVIGIALALPLSLMLLLQNLQALGNGLDGNNTISAYLDVGLDEVGRNTLAATLQDWPDISGVRIISPETALAEFREASGLGEVLDGLDENPLPAVLEVVPADTATGAVDVLADYLRATPGIADVQVDLQWLQRLDAMVALAMRLALMLAGMLGLGVLLVIVNTIRLAIENRRAEIVVVKLVGGTDTYVALPFLYTGLWYGVGGGLLAVLIVSIAMWGLQGPYARLLGAYAADPSLHTLTISSAFAVLLGAGLLGLTGAVISVYRHLRSIEPG